MEWSGSRGGVRCDARNHTWQTARPAGCPKESDFGQGFYVSTRSRRGQVVCAGDTVFGEWRHLRYGRSVRHAGVKCTSTHRGITCRNRRGHGFFISRQRYRLF
jgi:Family of unknown function (DUF6636)